VFGPFSALDRFEGAMARPIEFGGSFVSIVKWLGLGHGRSCIHSSAPSNILLKARVYSAVLRSGGRYVFLSRPPFLRAGPFPPVWVINGSSLPSRGTTFLPLFPSFSPPCAGSSGHQPDPRTPVPPSQFLAATPKFPVPRTRFLP